jgi:NAD(P)-dependent dehydrogenase (short-subunit alcohol dehydrogenase family)
VKIDLSGKTALVTGPTTGSGFAIAKGLAEAGAQTILNGRKQADVNKAVGKLKNEIPAAKARGFAADLSTAEGCAALVAAAPQVDILVNNMGIFEMQEFFNIPDSEWTWFFETNVMSGVRLSRAYLKDMMARKWARIVFISSESAINVPVEMVHYGFSKTAQLSVWRRSRTAAV